MLAVLWTDHHAWVSSIANSLLPAKEVWGKVTFLHLSVILFTRKWGLPDRDPPGQRSPLDRDLTVQRSPLDRDLPEHRTPLDRDPLGQRPHFTQTPWTQTPLDRDPTGQRPLDKDPLGQRPPWTETPLDRDPLGQRPPWTETPLDSEPPERILWTESHPGQGSLLVL